MTNKLKLFTLIFIIFICVDYSYGDNKISENQKVYKKLISELRCMVCQNQSLEESEAPLAVDLKNKIQKMISQGKTEEEIKIFLVNRYSSFILYEPPIVFQNLLLWISPFVFLILLAYFLFRKILGKK